MRNRTHGHHQQRSYKHREQQRIPEYFVGEDTYYDQDDCCYHYPHGRRTHTDFSDCESVDSYTKYKKSKPASNNNDPVSALQNRYAVLDMEESSLDALLCENNEQQGSTYKKEASILNSSCKTDVSGDTDAGVCRQQNWSSWFREGRQNWIDSWSKEDNRDRRRYFYRMYSYEEEGHFWIIHVDGFFRKNRKAGYGVIIRDRYGVPLLASSSIHKHGKPVSWVYHTLQGIDRALELAIKYGFHKVYLFYTLPHAVDRLIQKIPKNPDSTYNIEECFRNNCKSRDEFRLVYLLFHEIMQKCCMFNDSDPKHYRYDDSTESELYCRNIKRKYNVSADYLAKLQVNKKEMKPGEFSEELKDILYEEEHTFHMIGTKEWRWGILESPGCW